MKAALASKNSAQSHPVTAVFIGINRQETQSISDFTLTFVFPHFLLLLT
jgi:hypothetical protein